MIETCLVALPRSPTSLRKPPKPLVRFPRARGFFQNLRKRLSLSTGNGLEWSGGSTCGASSAFGGSITCTGRETLPLAVDFVENTIRVVESLEQTKDEIGFKEPTTGKGRAVTLPRFA